MSKRRRALAKALIAGTALYGLTRPSMMGGTETVSDAQKKTQVRKQKSPTRAIDTGATTMVGGKVKTTVDQDASPREIKEKAATVRAANEKMKKKVIKRKEEGKLSPLMPKSESQYKAMQKKNSGLGMFDGAKKGKMIRARGGGMAIQGMKPTKLY